MKVNLASGHKKKSGFVNVDVSEKTKPDVCSDAFEYLKSLPTNSVSVLYSSHYLEHVQPEVYLDFLEEMYRVTKPDGKWILKLPFITAGNLYGNPLHFRCFWFGYFDSFKPNAKDNYTNIKVIDESKKQSLWKKIFYFHFPYLIKNREICFTLRVIK